MQGAGTGLGEAQQPGARQQQDEKDHHDAGEHQALPGGERPGAAQGEALLQEDDANQDAAQEAQKASNRRQITAAEPQDHPQGAAQEDQGAHHHHKAQQEAHGGGGAGTGTELLRGESGAEGAQHEADDLRPDVLHLPGAVEADGARDIPQEAGNAEAHVAGVAVGRQHQGGDADDHAGEQDHAVLPEPVGFFHVFSS